MLNREEVLAVHAGWQDKIDEFIDNDDRILPTEKAGVRQDYHALFSKISEEINKYFNSISSAADDMSSIIINAVTYLTFMSPAPEINLRDYYSCDRMFLAEVLNNVNVESLYEGENPDRQHSRLAQYANQISTSTETEEVNRRNLISNMKNSMQFNTFRCIFEGESPDSSNFDIKQMGKIIYENWGAAEIINTYGFHIYIPSYIGVSE